MRMRDEDDREDGDEHLGVLPGGSWVERGDEEEEEEEWSEQPLDWDGDEDGNEESVWRLGLMVVSRLTSFPEAETRGATGT